MQPETFIKNREINIYYKKTLFNKNNSLTIFKSDHNSYICVEFGIKMADNPIQLLYTLSANIQQLKKRYEASLIKEKELQDELDKQKVAFQALQQELDSLNTKYRNLKMTLSLNTNPDEVKDVKNKFNKLVREIDKCIALLNE